MRVTLTVTDGPHRGLSVVCDGHDIILVGRSADARLCLEQDLYLSRNHFLVEVNPPACRLLNLSSRNPTVVNGRKVESSTPLDHGDEVQAGQSGFRLQMERTNDASPLPPPAVPVDLSTLPPAGAGSASPIPGYELLSELGRGGMGVVFKARRHEDGATVALKVVLPQVRPGRDDLARFRREAEVMQRLSHPHIVACYDRGEVDGLPYLVMEYVDGTDASRLVKEHGPLAVGRAVAITCQLLGALAYAHEQGYVHRDVKPSNLLIQRVADGGEVVKLADFGLSRAYQASRMSGLTEEGTPGGTPAYMPPEQVTNFRDAKPPADQYGAAATLYYLLTRQGLYDPAGGAVAALLQRLQEDPVPLRRRVPDLPAGLESAVMRALLRRPVERWPDVRAFGEALRPFAEL